MAIGSSRSSSTSSVSSLTSFGGGSSDETVTAVKGPVVKFVCSYGGKILPRHHDGRLRYVGGDTRVLAVDRGISFSELAAKMAELPGWGVPVSVRCKLPTEDLDALVSVTCDADLANLLEEYDLANRERDSPLKIKAVLAPRQPQHHHPAPMKAPATPPTSATRVYSPFTPSAAERCARHGAHGLPPQQQLPCAAASSSRPPTRPPASACYGQAAHRYSRHDHHRNPTCVIHAGGAGGGPGAATSYRLAMMSS